MGLDNRDHLAGARFARCCQGRPDLDGVVAVVIDHRDATDLTGLGEAPLNTAEAVERLSDDVVMNLELIGDRDRCERVQHIVRPGMAARNASKGARHLPRDRIAQLDIEDGAIGIEHWVQRLDVGVLVEPIADQPAIRRAVKQRLGLGVIHAHGGKAVERQIVQEGLERRFYTFEITIEIKDVPDRYW